MRNRNTGAGFPTAAMLSMLGWSPAFAKGTASCTSLTDVRTFKDTTITAARMIGADRNA